MVSPVLHNSPIPGSNPCDCSPISLSFSCIFFRQIPLQAHSRFPATSVYRIFRNSKVLHTLHVPECTHLMTAPFCTAHLLAGQCKQWFQRTSYLHLHPSACKMHSRDQASVTAAQSAPPRITFLARTSPPHSHAPIKGESPLSRGRLVAHLTRTMMTERHLHAAT